MGKQPKVALVHDWIVSLGGGEKVLWQLHLLFPDAPIYTLVYDPACGGGMFKGCDVRTTYLQKVPFAPKLYRNMLTLMPRAWEALDLTEYDLVVSSCSSCCKGVITRPDAVHVCYCHTPTRYVWDFYHAYLNNSGWLKRRLIPGMMHKMRGWDRLAADRVDHFVSNSDFIARRIQKFYRRGATTIYPPVAVRPLPQQVGIMEKPYYLVVSRLVYYKRVDVAIAACNQLGRRLLIIGGGPEEKPLRAAAGPTVTFLGRVDDDEVTRRYAGAKAFLFPGEEDFGITPVEAQSMGCPVLAYGRGGALETVKDGATGLFFQQQTAESLADCILRFEAAGVACNREELHAHSLMFGEARFRDEMGRFCQEKLAALPPFSGFDG